MFKPQWQCCTVPHLCMMFLAQSKPDCVMVPNQDFGSRAVIGHAAARHPTRIYGLGTAVAELSTSWGLNR